MPPDARSPDVNPQKKEERVRLARTASAEELWSFVRDSHPETAAAAALNPRLTEEMALYLAGQRSTPSETLGLIAIDHRFKPSYRLKLLLCRNPKTAQKVVLSLLKFLRVFDLGDLTRDQRIPMAMRQKIENMLLDRIPSMPSGLKIALSKHASSTAVIALMERGDARVMHACLESPLLKESHLYGVISREQATTTLIRMIAEHKKWSLRYHIRFALLRHRQTPLIHATRFISEMKTADLQELYADPSLPSSTRPFIFRELGDRNEPTGILSSESFELSEVNDDPMPES